MIFNTYVLSATETGAMIGGGINSLARKTLTITLFFIGASLSFDVLKAVGIKPLIQGVLLWIVISVSTLAYIYLFWLYRSGNSFNSLLPLTPNSEQVEAKAMKPLASSIAFVRVRRTDQLTQLPAMWFFWLFAYILKSRD